MNTVLCEISFHLFLWLNEDISAGGERRKHEEWEGSEIALAGA
jgi:hypothetical protein